MASLGAKTSSASISDDCIRVEEMIIPPTEAGVRADWGAEVSSTC